MFPFSKGSPILWFLSSLKRSWVPTLPWDSQETLPQDLVGVWLTDREKGQVAAHPGQGRASYQLSPEPGTDRHPGNG